jgi:hypothetical protein
MNAYEDLKKLNIDEILIVVINVIIKELFVQINMNLLDDMELKYKIVEYQLNLELQNQQFVYMSYHAYNVQKNEQYVPDKLLMLIELVYWMAYRKIWNLFDPEKDKII